MNCFLFDWLIFHPEAASWQSLMDWEQCQKYLASKQSYSCSYNSDFVLSEFNVIKMSKMNDTFYSVIPETSDWDWNSSGKCLFSHRQQYAIRLAGLSHSGNIMLPFLAKLKHKSAFLHYPTILHITLLSVMIWHKTEENLL